MNNTFNKRLVIFSALVIGVGSLLTFAQGVYAITPTVTATSAGSGNVLLNVTGDANSSVILNYLTTGSALQTATLGATNTNGTFSTTINTASYSVLIGSLFSITINGTRSDTQYWPLSSQTSNSTILSLSQTNASLSVGQILNVLITGTGSYYVQTNSNPLIASASISGSTVIINSLSIGSTTISVCSTSGACNSIYISVATNNNPIGGTGQIAFGVTNPTVTLGQNMSISLSGGSGYYISSNSNANVVQASVSGSSLMLYGASAGSTSVTVCASSIGCNVLSVTVSGSSTTTTNIQNTATNAALLSAIQSMQAQLVQMVTQIQSMTITLNQLASQVIAGTQTSSTTGSTTSNSSYVFTQFLAVGSQGAEVTALQKKLSALGFYSGSATGYYGTLTEDAVKKFQTAHGIDPQGYVGPGTRAELNK